MPLQTAPAYPAAADPEAGTAVVNILKPHERTWDLADHELVRSAREHAGEWERFADRLNVLLDAGWSLRSVGGLYAIRSTTASSLADLVDTVAEPGIAVEWCLPDASGSLLSVGGMFAGAEPPRETLPGSPLPALVANELTGAQRIVDNEQDLRAAVRDELHASALWWSDHPQEMSDLAAHGIVDDLHRCIETLAGAPVPASVSEEPNPRHIFGDQPTTRVSVHPVSAIVFGGLMEATNTFSTLTFAPKEGLSQTYTARGRELADELGLRP